MLPRDEPCGGIPEDPDERARWLEQWASRQQERAAGRVSLRARLRRTVDTVIDRQVERLDPVLDRRLDTASDVFLPSADGEGAIYVAGATPWDVLPRALHKVGASDQDVFVELGCGKGRVVHQAAKRPLKKVVGVERIPEIARFAESLVAANRAKYRCQSVEIVTCDADQFRVPDDLTIAYHAYGFDEKTMDTVLANLIESVDRRPRILRLIYYWPRFGGAQVLATGRFRHLPDMSFGRTLIFESCG